MKRKNHLEALVAMTLTDRGGPLVAEVALRGDEGGGVVLREGEAGEETEEEGEAGSREVEEVVDGIKVEEEEEEEAGGWRGEVEVEVWKEGVGDLKEGWTKGEGGEWKGEVGVRTEAEEEAEVVVGWREILMKGAGAVLIEGVGEEVEWIVVVGREKEVEAVFQGAAGEGLTHLYLCSAISKKCPIHMEVREQLMNPRLQATMKMMMRIPLKLGGERKVKILAPREEVAAEEDEVWKTVALVGGTGVVLETTGEHLEEEEVVLEEEEMALEEEEEDLEQIEVVEAANGEARETEDRLLDPPRVGELHTGFVQTPLARHTAMVRIRASVPNVELQDLVRRELTKRNLCNTSL